MQSLCWISQRKSCFHYGITVCLKPWHTEYPCLPVHPAHVPKGHAICISWALPQAFASWAILLRHSIRPGRLLKEHRDGFPRSESSLFCDLRMVLHRTCGGCRCTPGLIRGDTMYLGTTWPETRSLLGLQISRLAGST